MNLLHGDVSKLLHLAEESAKSLHALVRELPKLRAELVKTHRELHTLNETLAQGHNTRARW